MVKVRIKRADGIVQRYDVKSRKPYTKIGKVKGKAVYGKIKRPPVVKPPVEIPPEELPPDMNIKAKIFFKLEDYGVRGSGIYFNCWMTKVFAPHEFMAVEHWYDTAREYMLDRIHAYGHGTRAEAWHSLVDTVFGYETVEAETNDEIGSTEELFSYSHDGKRWTSF